jgi:hypothetical protein
MTIKVLTNVRADSYFLELWLRHYGSHFGRENLHVMFDGDDWEPQTDLTGVKVHVVSDIPRERLPRLRRTSIWQSNFANRLLKKGASVVLRTDIDEFVALDPGTGSSLPDFLEGLAPDSMTAALGVDVVQAAGEGPLDPDRTILAQRRNAVITREFSKLVAVRRPLRWMNGFHRGRDVPIDLAPGLMLFHLNLFDTAVAERRIAERKAILEHATQATHIARRLDRLAELDDSAPLPFDDVAARAHQQIMVSLPSPTGPHPGRITDGNSPRGYHVLLPDRFAGLLPNPAP